ncbi:MAG: ornithine carbamoyltransferase [Candidatus Omnitrophica bacterium]|nr:ornithine carbamoyltransferase [Candidatus Omnitrophota bacterium]MDD5027581.1 ornithine carbamoyltransferase [Candidatus Omnitrophota bacterium]MDD5662381.1 ornithine carbamoyltransferase [Candidatus Omnitrophota bacterium]
MKKDLLTINDLTVKEIQELFSLTDKLKKNKAKFKKTLFGKTLVLIFQKPSNRTRVSFEVGMFQLGGNSLYLAPNEINLGVRESIADVARTLSRYADGIVIRTFEHKNCLELAKEATVPVINGLSDFSHPCQALADLYTVKEKLKVLKGLTLAYVGDGNNVCNSLLFICAKLGVNMNIGCPKGYEPEAAVLKEAKAAAEASGIGISLFNDAFSAVKGVDVIYTDVWASMGQEDEAAKRKEAFRNFQVNKDLVKLAKANVLIMHCLPAHRGEEITDDVLNSRNAVIFDEAENRMHVQKAVLIKLLGR